jgi:PadR family transcriptional regulator PadR
MRFMRRKSGSLVPLELSVLSALAQLETSDIAEAHGYEIARHIAQASERKLLTAYGTLYRALGRLERMGLLDSRWEDPHIALQEARPTRRLYRLSDAGRAAARVGTRDDAKSLAPVRKAARA